MATLLQQSGARGLQHGKKYAPALNRHGSVALPAKRTPLPVRIRLPGGLSHVKLSLVRGTARAASAGLKALRTYDARNHLFIYLYICVSYLAPSGFEASQ